MDDTTTEHEDETSKGRTASIVHDAWSRALQTGEVDTETGFFDLGADSMNLIEVFEVLRSRWPWLRVVDLFEHPSIKSLSDFIDQVEI